MSIPDLPVTPMFEPKVAGQPHRLQHAWAFWCQKKEKRPAGASWYEGTQCLGRFNTIEGFWQLYTHIVRPEKLQGSVDIMLFKDGIKPLWEDAANREGGKMTIRLRKQGASAVWEELILAMIGEQFDVGNEICGAVLACRFRDDNMSLWHRTADNENAVNKIRDTMTRILALPSFLEATYTRHSSKLHHKDRDTGKQQQHQHAGDGGDERGHAAADGAGDHQQQDATSPRGGWRDRAAQGYGPSGAAASGRDQPPMNRSSEDRVAGPRQSGMDSLPLRPRTFGSGAAVSASHAAPPPAQVERQSSDASGKGGPPQSAWGRSGPGQGQQTAPPPPPNAPASSGGWGGAGSAGQQQQYNSRQQGGPSQPMPRRNSREGAPGLGVGGSGGPSGSAAPSSAGGPRQDQQQQQRRPAGQEPKRGLGPSARQATAARAAEAGAEDEGWHTVSKR